MRRLASLGLIACFVSFSAGVLAQPTMSGEAELRREARRAKTWRYTWTAVNGGLTAGAFVAAPLVSREERPDFIVSGIGSAITTICTWAWPLRVEHAPDELDALPPAEQVQRLRRESAKDERERIRWPWHVANIGLAAAGGAVIAFGYRHYSSGALTAAAGSAIGELQLFTQPTGLTRDPAIVPRLAFTPKLGGGETSVAVGVAGSF
jgi:hypothetical protein